MKQFKHVVITRYNLPVWSAEEKRFVCLYEDKDAAKKWMKERYELFKATRESVLSQDVDFEWIIAFNEKTSDSDVNKIVTNDKMTAIKIDVPFQIEIEKYFKDLDIKEDFVITTRLDNDDVYLNGALDSIQQEFNPMLMVIDIEYNQYDLNTGKYYGSDRYTPTGPFISLVEPSNKVKTCYCRPHSNLAAGYPTNQGKIKVRPIRIETPSALMVIHNNNVANKIVGREIR